MSKRIRVFTSLATPDGFAYQAGKVYTVTNELADDFIAGRLAEEVDDLTPFVSALRNYHGKFVPTKETPATVRTRLASEGLIESGRKLDLSFFASRYIPLNL